MQIIPTCPECHQPCVWEPGILAEDDSVILPEGWFCYQCIRNYADFPPPDEEDDEDDYPDHHHPSSISYESYTHWAYRRALERRMESDES